MNTRNTTQAGIDADATGFLLALRESITGLEDDLEPLAVEFVDETPTVAYRTRKTDMDDAAEEIRRVSGAVAAAYIATDGRGPDRTDVIAYPPEPIAPDDRNGAKWTIDRELALAYGRDELSGEEAVSQIADGVELVELGT